MTTLFKFLKRSFAPFLFIFTLCFAGAYALADSGVLAPQDFIAQVFEAVKGFGGASWALKISSIVLLLIASMKVSFLDQLFWNKLGAFQAWLAPILGLVGGLAVLATNGQLTLAGVMAYVSAGAGALILHELLDTVKALPGLGSVYVGIIDTVEGFLKSDAAK